jgi:hypothetical protein
MNRQFPSCVKFLSCLAPRLGTAVLVAAVTLGAWNVLDAGSCFGTDPNLSCPVSPFTFDAPAWNTARVKAGAKAGAQAISSPTALPTGEVIFVDDWTYTAIVRGAPQPS